MSHRASRENRWTRLLPVFAALAFLSGQGRSQQLPGRQVVHRKPASSQPRAHLGLRRDATRPADSGAGLVEGTIFTVAGQLDSVGYTADGGPATQTTLAFPTGVALDASNTLYIADTVNNVIRAVSSATPSNPSPTISTVAGSPPPDNTFSNQIADSCGTQLLNATFPASQGCLLNGYPATGSAFGTVSFLTVPSDVKVDADGNIYILDAGDQVVTVVYSGRGTQLKAVLARLAAADPGVGYENPQPGYMYTLAGTLDVTTINYSNAVLPPTPALTGDNGPAVRGGGLTPGATFGGSTVVQSGGASGPMAMFVDAGGNIYLADTNNNLVRVIYEGATVPPALTALHITPVAGYIYTIAGTYNINDPNSGGDGLNDCGALQVSTLCGEGGPATSAFLSFPAGIAVDARGNVFISDQFDNVIRVVYVSGGVPGVSAQVLATYTPGNIYTIAGDKSGLGNFTNSCIPSPGNCGEGGAASASTLYSPANLAFDVNGNLYLADNADQVVRAIYVAGKLPNQAALTAADVGHIYTVAGHIAGAGNDGVNYPSLNVCVFDPSTNCGDGGPATSGYLYNPAGLAFDSLNNLYIADTGSASLTSGDSVVREVVGIAPARSQTISFPAAGSPALPSQVIYGAAPIQLTATASSGLTVAFAVSGAGHLSGTTVVIDKVGAITITASQAGNSAYLPAPPVTVTIQVTQATLTVTGAQISLTFGSPAPDFSGDYTITGFQYGDTGGSAISGSPVVTPAPAYTPATPVGTAITLVVTRGTLAAPGGNYRFAFVNGSVTITGGATQTITFPAIPNQIYGAKPLTLTATSSSGLPVTYAVASGNSAARISGSLLTITGVAPQITVTASQAGSNVFAPAAPVSRTFAIDPAPLSITANNVTVIQGGTIPPLNYSISGFVYSDTQQTASTGAPTLTAGATSSDAVGTYPISISAGSFVAPNYSPAFVNGTLTIIPPTPQTITFVAPSTPVVYGTLNLPLIATASSGLPITFSVSGPGTLVGSALQVNGVGTITVTASQSGNGIYGAAPKVSHSISVDPAVLTVTANSFTLPIATPVPNLTYAITGLVNNDSQSIAISGAPVLTTTDEGASSPQGTYPITITQGTLKAANYTFTFVNGNIVVLPGPPPDYTVTVNPTSITMAPGQIRQATLFVVPINGYVNKYDSKSGVGGIAFTCGALPANVTCAFSPAVVSVDGHSQLVGPAVGSGELVTLTVDASGATAAIRRPQSDDTRILPAAVFFVPGCLAGVVLAFHRRRLSQSSSLWRGLIWICLLGGLAGMGACGYANTQNTSSFAKKGTDVIAIDAVGAPSTNSPTGSTNALAHSVNLTVTIQ